MVGVESAVRPAFSGCQCTPDPAVLSARHVRVLRLRIRRRRSTASWQLGVYGSESTHHIESLARWVPAPKRAMRAEAPVRGAGIQLHGHREVAVERSAS